MFVAPLAADCMLEQRVLSRLRKGFALSSHHRFLLEVCVGSVEDAVTASVAGADRLELNVALELGGLTPSLGLFEEVKQAVKIPVVALVRCRPGGFCYSPVEQRIMLRDSEMLLAAGADGIVSGALRQDRKLDHRYWDPLKNLCGDRELIFHRAVDATVDQNSLLLELIDSETSRVLTSGGCSTAWEGRERISQHQKALGNEIEILVGSGVSPENALALVRSTGCSQVHGSFSMQRQDPYGYFGSQTVRETSKDLIAATRVALDAGYAKNNPS